MKNRTESSYSLYRGKDERWCEPASRVTGTLLNALLEVTWVPWQWKLQKKPCRIAQHHDSASLNNLRKGYLYTAKYRCNCIAYLQTNLNLFRNKRKWQHQPVLVVWKLSRIHRMIFSCSCLTKVLLHELVRLHWQRYSSTRHSHGFLVLCSALGILSKIHLYKPGKGQVSVTEPWPSTVAAVGVSITWKVKYAVYWRNAGFLEVWKMCNLPAGILSCGIVQDSRLAFYKASKVIYCTW